MKVNSYFFQLLISRNFNGIHYPFQNACTSVPVWGIYVLHNNACAFLRKTDSVYKTYF